MNVNSDSQLWGQLWEKQHQLQQHASIWSESIFKQVSLLLWLLPLLPQLTRRCTWRVFRWCPVRSCPVWCPGHCTESSRLPPRIANWCPRWLNTGGPVWDTRRCSRSRCHPCTTDRSSCTHLVDTEKKGKTNERMKIRHTQCCCVIKSQAHLLTLLTLRRLDESLIAAFFSLFSLFWPAVWLINHGKRERGCWLRLHCDSHLLHCHLASTANRKKCSAGQHCSISHTSPLLPLHLSGKSHSSAAVRQICPSRFSCVKGWKEKHKQLEGFVIYTLLRSLAVYSALISNRIDSTTGLTTLANQLN